MPRLRKSRPVSALAASRRDPAQFERFYAAYVERVLVYFARRTLDLHVATDLMSETFALALERRHQFRGATLEEEQGWLFAIAHNLLVRYWRDDASERRAVERLRLEPVQLEDSALQRIERLAELEGELGDLRAAMSSLPPDQRMAVGLRMLDELEYRDVARLMGVSEPAARTRVSRGLRALADAMPAVLPEEPA